MIINTVNVHVIAVRCYTTIKTRYTVRLEIIRNTNVY